METTSTIKTENHEGISLRVSNPHSIGNLLLPNGQTSVKKRKTKINQFVPFARAVVFFLGLTRYIAFGTMIFYFIPLFSLVLPCSFGLLLILISMWGEDGTKPSKGNTLTPPLMLQISISISMVYDLLTVLFMSILGIQFLYAILSEPSGGKSNISLIQ